MALDGANATNINQEQYIHPIKQEIERLRPAQTSQKKKASEADR